MITLACDFGGTRIKLGLIRDGSVLASTIIPAHADRPLKERLGPVARLLSDLCTAQNCNPNDCAGIGLSYPSIIDTPNARILDHFGKFGHAASLNLRAWARQQFGLPLAIDNDARLALAGEWRHGAARNCDNVVMLTLGTGLGAAAIIQGQLLRGAHGQAGILGGHLTVQLNGRPCVCGNVGCAEAEASSWQLQTLAKEQPNFHRSPLAHLPALTYAHIFQLAAQGDPTASALREHSLRVWSAATVNLIHAYDPELIVLGGGIMNAAAVILPAIRDYTLRHAHTPWGKVRLSPSNLGDHAALLGCEWLLQEQLASAA